ncbi:MAG: hypothetical protein ABII07_00470 [Patescibacteria group bacterium]|nr:hypothetical protein [Patescibacteria group bacterium]
MLKPPPENHHYPCANLTPDQMEQILDIYDHVVGDPRGDLKGRLRHFGIENPSDHALVFAQLEIAWKFFTKISATQEVQNEVRMRLLRGELHLS